jgi:hypothetical protein
MPVRSSADYYWRVAHSFGLVRAATLMRVPNPTCFSLGGQNCNSKLRNGSSKDWSALADDFRTFVLSAGVPDVALPRSAPV